MVVNVREVRVLDLAHADESDVGEEFAVFAKFASDPVQRIFVVAVDHGLDARFGLTVVDAPPQFQAVGATFNMSLPFRSGEFVVEGEVRAGGQLRFRTVRDARVFTVGDVQLITRRLRSSLAS